MINPAMPDVYAQSVSVEGQSEQPSLAPCKDTPNCVSSLQQGFSYSLEPLAYFDSRENMKKKLLAIIQKMKRSEIVKVTDLYIHAEFRTRLGFTDDVEFLFDDQNRLLHFRSASRKGYFDFGVNRRRMKHITAEMTGKGVVHG